MTIKHPLELERAALGEAPCPDELRGAVAALERSNAEILAALPPDAVAREVARRASRSTPARAPAQVWLAAAAAAGAVAMFVLWRAPAPAMDAPEVVRAKGTPRLIVHRKRGAEIAQLEAPAAAARAGDLLQLAYLPAGAIHGVVLSVDGGGQVTLHFPTEASGSTRLVAAGPSPLDHAYELDAAPDFEQFWFITSRQPISVAAVLAAAERWAADPAAADAPLALPPGLEQWSLRVRKESSP